MQVPASFGAEGFEIDAFGPDAIVLTFPVAREFTGQRIDRFIQNRIPRLSRTRAQAIVRACAIRPDGTRRRPSDRVRAGEVVYLVRKRFREPDTPRDFRILHQDDEVLALDKPAGLPMHPTATYHRNTLSYLLRERFGANGPRIAHRLDRETSGVVLCGRTREAERHLKQAFEHRRVTKTYLAIVRGVPSDTEGEIGVPLGPSRTGLHVMMEARDDGLPARTRFRVLETSRAHALVWLRPETGRQHQLRVHLADRGHPIVGDKLYGPEGQAPFLDYIEQGGMTPDLSTRLGHDRQALHAHRVEFDHPAMRTRFAVESPLAPDLVRLWHAC